MTSPLILVLMMLGFLSVRTSSLFFSLDFSCYKLGFHCALVSLSSIFFIFQFLFSIDSGMSHLCFRVLGINFCFFDAKILAWA
ncbi:hypothetical protein AMTRI_Chr06g172950 [Amborella trichopoda]